MRKRRGWTASDVDKLKTMAGKHPVDRIAEELGWGPAAVPISSTYLWAFIGIGEGVLSQTLVPQVWTVPTDVTGPPLVLVAKADEKLRHGFTSVVRLFVQVDVADGFLDEIAQRYPARSADRRQTFCH
jgi:hypothetical protein